MPKDCTPPTSEELRVESDLQKFLQAAEQSPSQLMITDRNGVIEYVNPRFCEVTGFSRNEVLGKTSSVCKPRHLSPEFPTPLRDTGTDDDTWRGEFLNHRKDGSLYWERASIEPIRSLSGEITHFIKVAEDITDRKRAEEAQRRTIKLTEAVTAANLCFIETGNLNQMSSILTDACMTVTNSPFGMLCEILPNGTADILALSMASFDAISAEPVFRDIQYEIRRHGHHIVQQHHSLLFAPLQKGASVVINAAADNEWKGCDCPLCRFPFHRLIGIPLKIGTLINGIIFLANREDPYPDEEVQELELFAQTCSLALGSARAELDRKQTREQLRQAQKMEAIGQLAGGISHDFNNLLTVINGYSSLLIQKIEASDARRKDVEQILSAGERAAALIKQLLAFGRRQLLEPRQLSINSLVAGLHKILCRLLDENITLDTRLAPDIGLIRADSSQIEQIVMNLVINARDAMERGGAITISTENRFLDAAFVRQNNGATQGHHVMLSVRDTGMGMSEEVIARIFEPFFTTKEQGYGTGLGLATVYGIVKQSNGYIKVISEVGIGTEFRIFFPREQEQEQPSAGGGYREPAAQDTGSALVLIVEDERTVLDLSAITLSSKGFRVLTASGPLEAIALFEKNRDEISVVLSDIIMPEMSGPEMAKMMLAVRPDLKVIFMSGYADDRLKNSDFNRDATSFIMKPFNPIDLVEVVNASITESR